MLESLPAPAWQAPATIVFITDCGCRNTRLVMWHSKSWTASTWRLIVITRFFKIDNGFYSSLSFIFFRYSSLSWFLLLLFYHLTMFISALPLAREHVQFLTHSLEMWYISTKYLLRFLLGTHLISFISQMIT